MGSNTVFSMSSIEQLMSLFFRFVDVPAPSGFEEPMMKALQSELAPYVDELKITPRGNVIAVQNGPKGSPKIALAAHMDQIGFIVFNIEQAGWVRFRKIGGSVNRCIQGQQVMLHTGKGPVSGVVGVKPGHITPPFEANTVPAIEEMYIDIGARSKEEVVLMGVKPGVPVTFATAPIQLANGERKGDYLLHRNRRGRDRVTRIRGRLIGTRCGCRDRGRYFPRWVATGHQYEGNLI
jgi:putative aminopeptidase FrvX